jgi:hypothetical protein
MSIFSQTTQQGNNCGVAPFAESDIGSVRKFLPKASIGKRTLQQLLHTDRLQCRQCINFVVTLCVDIDLLTKEDGIIVAMDVAVGRTVEILQFMQYVRMGATILGGMEMAPMIRYKSDSLTIMSNASTPVLSCRDDLVPLLAQLLPSSSGVVQNVNQRFGYGKKCESMYLMLAK